MGSPVLGKGVSIVGAALSDIGTPGIAGVSSAYELAAQASLRALSDAGLSLVDVDALFCTGLGVDSTLEFADYLGLDELSYADSTAVGGASWVTYVEHASAAIEAGLCNTALLAHGSTAFTDRKRPTDVWGDPRSPLHQFDLVYGNDFMVAYALAAQRYLWQFGLGMDALAPVAVSTRAWAALNPLACNQSPLTVDEVLNSPMVASPLHLLECCLISDGGGAIVITRLDRAADTRAPVRVLGMGSSQMHLSIAQMSDLTRSPANRSGARAYAAAALSPKEVDPVMLYDSFSITPIMALEDLGFCERGEAPAFVESGHTAPGGDLPMNTNGGGLSFAHTGMYGVFTLIEAVTQLRGEAGRRQVPRCEVALSHGVGEFLSATGTVLLAAGLT